MINLLIKISLFSLLAVFISGCLQNASMQTDTSQSAAIVNTDNKSAQSPKPSASVTPNPPQYSGSIDIPRDSSTRTSIKCKSKELYEILMWLQENDGDVPYGNMDWDCSDIIKIKRHYDLNGDGVKEVFVEGAGIWGSVSTSAIWVMQKKKHGYTILLREQGELFEVKKTSTNGYRDLYFPSRRSVWSTFLSTYKFKKNSYYKAKCRIEFYDAPAKIRKEFNCEDEKGITQFEDESRSAN